MGTQEGVTNGAGDPFAGLLDAVARLQKGRTRRLMTLKQKTKKDAAGCWQTVGEVRGVYTECYGETRELLEANFHQEGALMLPAGAEWLEGFLERETIMTNGRLTKFVLTRAFQCPPVEPSPAS